jgi:Fe-S-cluster-containing dehydrogenase component
VPKSFGEIDQMLKCDLCYDRTSAGKKPMCATVCPSQALAFTTREEIERTRKGATVRDWGFGAEPVRTRVYVVVPESAPLVATERVSPAATPIPEVSYDVAELLGG